MTSLDTSRDRARQARGQAEQAANSKWLTYLARFGLAAQGVSYAIVAVLALKLAFGEGGKTTSREGAFQTLADSGYGRILLILLAIGFVGYALWRFATAIFDRDDDGADAKGFAKRGADAAKGLIYAGLTVSVVHVLMGAGGGGQSSQQKATGGVLGWPAGRWLVGAAGVAVLAAALWNLYRGLSKKFEDDLRCEQMSRRERTWISRIGTIGLCARAVVFGIIGWFVIKAATEFDSGNAIGLGGALAKLAQASHGRVLLGVTAAGLFVFGVFCLAQARYRDV